MQRILDVNPLTGEWITFDYEADGDKVTVGHWQDTTKIIEDNKRAMLDVDSHRKQAKNEWALYARIPNIVIMEWKQKYGVDFFNKDHWKRVMQLINSPDYKDLKRTTYFHDR